MSKLVSLAKVFGIALATFIIFMVISSLLFVANIFHSNKDESDLTRHEVIKESIMALDLDFANVNLYIETGDDFTVNTNIRNLEIKESEHKLKMSTSGFSFGKSNNRTINITVPKDLNLEQVKIDTALGKVSIKNITAREWDLSLGMAKTILDNISSLNKATIENGAGYFEANNCTFNNLDFQNGLGSAKLAVSLNGQTTFDNGLGSVETRILDSKDNYTIDINNSMGAVNVLDEAVSNGQLGQGSKRMSIDNGMGTVDIKFIN